MRFERCYPGFGKTPQGVERLSLHFSIARNQTRRTVHEFAGPSVAGKQAVEKRSFNSPSGIVSPVTDDSVAPGVL